MADPLTINLPRAVGSDGKSSYEIWLEEGNGGSEQDFLDSLASTITIDSVETLPPQLDATVENIGTTKDVVLKFGIPKGDPGSGSGIISLADYGADPAVDCGPQLTNAIIEASANGYPIDLGGETWVLTSQVTLASNVTIRNGKFDARTAVADATNNKFLFKAEGAMDAAIPLTADVTPNAAYPQMLSVTSAPLIGYDSYALLQDDRAVDQIATHYTGELVRFLANNGTQLQLDRPTVYEYLMSRNARIYRVAPIRNIRFENVVIEGPIPPNQANIANYKPCFKFALCENVELVGCEISGFNIQAVRVENCYKVSIDRCHIHDIPWFYGILAVGYTYGMEVSGCHLINTRHGFSIGADDGVVLFTKIHHNVVVGREAALDAHTGADFTEFTNNTCIGQGAETNPHGIIYQGRNFTCNGNVITGYLSNGIIYQSLHRNHAPATVIICNNTVETSAVVGTVFGLYLQTNNVNVLPIDRLVMTGNTIKGPFSAGVYLSAAGASISNFVLDNVLLDSAARGYYIRAQAASISNGTIRGAVRPAGTSAFPGVNLFCDAGQTMSNVTIDAAGFSNCANTISRSGTGTFSNIQLDRRNAPTVIATDAAFTINADTGDEIIHSGTLTANRVVTLSTTNIFAGEEKLVTRTGGGDFTLTVGGAVLYQNQWARFRYDDVSWVLIATGAVSSKRASTTYQVNTDAAFTIQPIARLTTVLHTGTLTAARAVTLGTTGVMDGDEINLVRTGGGAFNLTVNGGTSPTGSAQATNTSGRYVYSLALASWRYTGQTPVS